MEQTQTDPRFAEFIEKSGKGKVPLDMTFEMWLEYPNYIEAKKKGEIKDCEGNFYDWYAALTGGEISPKFNALRINPNPFIS